ncbi:SIR2 family NAD-dependent protein deacylase [Caldimonas thermodepolymerans]|uniref:SIR2 family NAD-dependent protein deacylase n=1 Tax=Caldimonas thermodepolymerans TaxID=215580 RepID=UPI002492B1E4|nr:SIR2 family protein [Caldimonas thermodepolymerans]
MRTRQRPPTAPAASLDDLRADCRRGKVLLFVGAGVSLSLGLPDWSELIDHMAQELGFEPDEFRGYGSYLALAEYFRLHHGDVAQLHRWMDRRWHDAGIRVQDSRVHELIVRGGFRLIYTTNYDRWLERAFEHHGRPYVKIVDVGDLAHIRPDATTQIVKFHGDFEREDSIVLDETSYFRRLEFESPLDIKLRADVLGRSVLFIGYSLSDVNLRYLFFRLACLWKQAMPGTPQPRSYIFTPEPNPVQQAVLGQWGIEMLSVDAGDPGQALAAFLEQVVG